MFGYAPARLLVGHPGRAERFAGQRCIQSKKLPSLWRIGETVGKLIRPKERDIGGFSVRRILPNVARQSVGPWVFFDHMGPVTFDPGHGIDVRPHPHINLATVTYLFQGEILHRDSLGNVQPITPGAVNLMFAGSGVVHSERESSEVRQSRHTLHGLQLWLALPESVENASPDFYHYSSAEIPSGIVNNVAVRVVMGEAYGLVSPVLLYSETLYVEAKLEAGQVLTIPEAAERAVYVVRGRLLQGVQVLQECTMSTIESNGPAQLQALEASSIVIIGGQNLGRRHLEWNFVSSRLERIQEAKRAWKAQRFSKIPGDEREFIPLPEDQ